MILLTLSYVVEIQSQHHFLYNKSLKFCIRVLQYHQFRLITLVDAACVEPLNLIQVIGGWRWWSMEMSILMSRV
jgi:hypothetical protein